MSTKQECEAFLKEWVLPPRASQLLRDYRLRRGFRYRKDWLFHPIEMNSITLPHFAHLDQKTYWLSLRGEVRPAVYVDRILDCELTNVSPASPRVQIGVGVPSRSGISGVDVYVNNELAARLEEIAKDEWHDVRFALQGVASHRVRIETRGRGNMYLSHPIVSSLHPKKRRPHNCIVIILDGVTPQLVEEGHGACVPNIRKFFSDGLTCRGAYAQGGWTLPTFSSMVSGLYASRHGVYNPDRNDASLPEDRRTLAQIFFENGFRTMAYSGHFRFSPAYGHAKGFERFIFRPHDNHYVKVVTDAVMHLESHKHEDNFVFLHVFDTHAGYTSSGYLNSALRQPFRHGQSWLRGKREGVEGYREYLDDERRAKLYEVDCALGALFSYLRRQEWSDDATVVVTADHGTAYGGYGTNGRPVLTEDRAGIVLLVKGPKIGKGEDRSLIEGSVDLMPSVLSIAGLPVPDGLDGRAWPFIGGKEREEVFSESLYRNTYEAAVRDREYCVHYRFPFDEASGVIDFENGASPVVFRRSEGRDIEVDVGGEIASIKDLSCRLRRYHGRRLEAPTG